MLITFEFVLRHSQSQGNQKRMHRDLQEMLTTWIKTNNVKYVWNLDVTVSNCQLFRCETTQYKKHKYGRRVARFT